MTATSHTQGKSHQNHTQHTHDTHHKDWTRPDRQRSGEGTWREGGHGKDELVEVDKEKNYVQAFDLN